MDADKRIASLRIALRYLHDPSSLQETALLSEAGFARTPAGAAEMRRLLVDEIRRMQPGPETPPDAPAWRLYLILLHRFIHRCSQLEVADQLGISERHLRREESKAISALADRLTERGFGVGQAIASFDDASNSTGAVLAGRAEAIDHELAWVDGSFYTPASIGEAMRSALAVVKVLAEQHKVTVTAEDRAGNTQVALHPVALHQALISLLSAGIRASSGTDLLLRAGVQQGCVEICVTGKGEVAPETFDRDESLQLGRRLLESCGGTLEHSVDTESFTIYVSVPGLEQRPVLVVEDNPDAIRLLQRYVEGTRYRVVGMDDVDEALSQAAQDRPAVIVLDVMMPDADGWQSLSRFRQHPLTSGIPLLVSTILPEEELAMSLGASGFLRKPFTRQEFLRALDRVCLEERVSPTGRLLR